MAFMQPQVYRGMYFEVETTHGTEIVPRDDGSPSSALSVDVAMLRDRLEGEPLDPRAHCDVLEGWLARLSAPGYLDCTPWGAYATEQEARDSLDFLYGTDEEEVPGSLAGSGPSVSA